MMLRVVVEGATLEFTEPRAGGPYPWLIGRGELHMQARAGHLEGLGATESPSLPVTLDNDGGQAVAALGRPLRALATMFDDDGDEQLSGLIARVAPGRTLELTIEA